MRVLIACEYSGRTREAFRAKGHDVLSCDLLPAEDNSPFHVVGDVFDVMRSRGPFDLMIAHPPCTYLANSGVRWLRGRVSGEAELRKSQLRWNDMIRAADFFARLYACSIPKIAIENPIMHGFGQRAIEAHVEHQTGHKFHMRSYTKFAQPWWFGDPFFKATGFTLKNLQPLKKPANALVPPKPGTPEHKAWSAVHLASPGPDRWKERSRTFPGIAQAMAEAWG